MSLPAVGTGVAITNPLVLYRALVATKRITPDPSQHRLAIHLQKLYDRLKDYEPTVEYKHRLNQISKAVGPSSNQEQDVSSSSLGQRGIWQSLLAQKEKRDSLALTRTLTSHEAAMSLDSPKGLMLHGEVGTGKSMLIDLFADCLPNRKKARWHFNTFILETFAKLEELRRDRLRPRIPQSVNTNGSDVDDYSLLWLAREMIQTSPILFLDEFQLPDRAASKIMTNLMTSFFQLGGVLIATSNRMPEELHKAAGITFAPPPSRMDSLAWSFGLGGRAAKGRSDNMFAGQGEFANFLDVLKARCEVWEMQGGRDYRRHEVDSSAPTRDAIDEEDIWHLDEHHDLQSVPVLTAFTPEPETVASIPERVAKPEVLADTPNVPQAPRNYLIRPSSSASSEEIEKYEANAASLASLIPSEWVPSTMRVYGRNVLLSRTNASTQTVSFTFAELCSTTAFGPADYISLASAYHTLILTNVPVLSLLQKNEARRFITLLDALYEARCKLLILDAEAGPDDLFFPTARKNLEGQEDAVYAETFAEAYQDATAPFRPNILASNPDFAEDDNAPVDYSHMRFTAMLAPDALEDDPPNRVRRHSPFARSASTRSDSPTGPIDPDDDLPYLRSLQDRAIHPDNNILISRAMMNGGPDFNKSSAFTGEDEKFAFKRAQSRIWEMCSAKWWARSEEGWHRPLPAHVRRWEGQSSSPSPSPSSVYMADQGTVRTGAGDAFAYHQDVGIGPAANVDEQKDEVLFRHKGGANPLLTRANEEKVLAELAANGAAAGDNKQRPTNKTHKTQSPKTLAQAAASPFRTSTEPPPTFSWTHIWGTMKWGKKAGAWGQGVDGLDARRQEKREREQTSTSSISPPSASRGAKTQGEEK
ncbi:hypothetical protein AAFC00_004490 [Neodothiora populina]|uniref:AAA+ ATPase domain-containing protein n=1 Tax=Neodothiora populina TaxID=2781224 RepID=A0ABR3P2D8_9PEZI